MSSTSSGWAPWWHYVVVLAATNGAAQVFLRDVDDVTNASVTAVIVVSIMIAMTWSWRAGAKARAPR